LLITSDPSFYAPNKKQEIRMKNGDQIPVSTMDGTEGELNLATKARTKDTCHIYDNRKVNITPAQGESEEKS
jgi:hypothetical protein